MIAHCFLLYCHEGFCFFISIQWSKGPEFYGITWFHCHSVHSELGSLSFVILFRFRYIRSSCRLVPSHHITTINLVECFRNSSQICPLPPFFVGYRLHPCVQLLASSGPISTSLSSTSLCIYVCHVLWLSIGKHALQCRFHGTQLLYR